MKKIILGLILIAGFTGLHAKYLSNTAYGHYSKIAQEANINLPKKYPNGLTQLKTSFIAGNLVYTFQYDVLKKNTTEEGIRKEKTTVQTNLQNALCKEYYVRRNLREVNYEYEYVDNNNEYLFSVLITDCL